MTAIQYKLLIWRIDIPFSTTADVAQTQHEKNTEKAKFKTFDFRMDSTIENTDNKAEFVTEQVEETPQVPNEEKTADDPDETGENAVENGAVVDRNLGDESNITEPEVNVDFETERAEGNNENTDKETIEIVEIEEKIIEVLEEAKSVEDNAQTAQETLVTMNLTAKEESETQPGTSEINIEPTEPPEEATQPPEEATQPERWIDLLGNGLLKKKVSFCLSSSNVDNWYDAIIIYIVHDTGLYKQNLIPSVSWKKIP